MKIPRADKQQRRRQRGAPPLSILQNRGKAAALPALLGTAPLASIVLYIHIDIYSVYDFPDKKGMIYHSEGRLCTKGKTVMYSNCTTHIS